MSHPKGSRKPRRPHRPSFARIARILPDVGSQEARLLSHVLRCELCTDAALSILAIGERAPKRRALNYEAAIAAAAAKAISIFEKRRRAMTVPDEETSADRSDARGSETD